MSVNFLVQQAPDRTNLSIRDPLQWYEKGHKEDGQDQESFRGPRLHQNSISISRASMLFLALGPYDDAVIPGEDCQLIQAGDEIPTGGDVSSEEDAEGEDGDWVHEVVLSCSRWAVGGSAVVGLEAVGSR